MNITPLSDIADMADGLPVICVSGTVKYAGDIEHGTSPKGFDWAKQFFVLSENGAEVGATLWQADGNEMKKGEQVLIENTQDKKGQWSGMVKGSYTNKKKELCHTLEIRANQVKIKSLNTNNPEAGGERQTSEANISAARRDDPPPQSSDGINEARQHLIKSANLYCMCIDAVRAVVAWKFTDESALTEDLFQAAVSTLYIEASRRITNDGVNWWSYVDRMPSKPVQNGNEKVERQTEEESEVPF